MISEDSGQISERQRFAPFRTLSSHVCVVFFLLLAFALTAAPAQARIHHKVHHKGHSSKHRILSLGDGPKYASIVMDARTGAILSQQDADKSVHPASLTKMMTLMVVFQALNEGRATLRDWVRVSSFAHSMMPSKLDVPAGDSIRLQDAIYSIVTHSSNDMAVALAEHIGGTQGTFVSMMNHKAAELGMKHTYFVNASGLHNPKQVTTARDMAILARALIYNYPSYYRYFSTRSFTYAGRVYPNHNHLMETYKGMDGIKTGFITQSGFNLVASARHGDHRLIGAIFGGRSARSRDVQMAGLLDNGFARLNATAVAAAEPAAPEKSVAVAETGTGAAGETGRWSQLGPVLQNKAASRLIGQGDEEDAEDASRPAAIQPPSPLPQTASIAPAAASSWAIQIGTYNSRAQTDQALQTAEQNLPPALRHGAPAIAPLQTINGWVFRARLNGFTRDEALRACTGIAGCLTVSPYAN